MLAGPTKTCNCLPVLLGAGGSAFDFDAETVESTVSSHRRIRQRGLGRICGRRVEVFSHGKVSLWTVLARA